MFNQYQKEKEYHRENWKGQTYIHLNINNKDGFPDRLTLNPGGFTNENNIDAALLKIKSFCENNRVMIDCYGDCGVIIINEKMHKYSEGLSIETMLQ